MRRVGWLWPAYVAAIGAVLVALQTGDPPIERTGAVLPFTVLVLAMATVRRPAEWTFAAAGLILTALSPAAAMTQAGGWLAVACIVLASITVMIAMTRSGAGRTIRRHRRIVAVLALLAGLIAIASFTVIAVNLPQALQAQPGCVDTCWGYAVSATLGIATLIELVAFTMVAVAFAGSLAAGLGALTVVVAENVLFGYGAPRPSASYAAVVVAWYVGAFIVTRRWTRPLPTAAGLMALGGEAGP